MKAYNSGEDVRTSYYPQISSDRLLSIENRSVDNEVRRIRPPFPAWIVQEIPSRGRRRKRSESLLSELTELNDEESDNVNEPRTTKEEDLEMDMIRRYSNKGTCSRPICL